jgi:HEAT repeat protein
VVVGPPVIVERPVEREPVIIREYRPPAPPKEPTPDPVAEKLQQKKSESLKKLKIGDPNNRVQAAKGLEQFEADAKVRTGLEQALLSDRDTQVRKSVAELFGRVQDKKTLPVLKQAQANDLDRDVRQAVYKAIILIEGY